MIKQTRDTNENGMLPFKLINTVFFSKFINDRVENVFSKRLAGISY